MLAYLAFRLLVDFIKPGVRVGGLSVDSVGVRRRASRTTRRTCPRLVSGGAAWVNACARTSSTTSPSRSAPRATSVSRARSSSRTVASTCSKWCPAHGHERVLMADDVDYYRRCREVFIKPPEMPRTFNTPMRWGCPVRLRALPGSPAAFVRLAHRDHRPLQPELPDLLRGERSVAPAVPHARPRPAAHRCGRAERRPAGRGADLRRRAHAAPGLLRDPRSRQGGPDPAPDGEHQRHPDRAGTRPSRSGWRPTCRTSRCTCSSIPSSADPLMALRGADLRDVHRARARTAERAGDVHHARRHPEERAERRRDRPDHRLRARAARRARRHVSAHPGGGPARALRPGHRPADAHRSAAPDPRADTRVPARGHAAGALPSRQPGHGVRAEGGWPGGAADRADRPEGPDRGRPQHDRLRAGRRGSRGRLQAVCDEPLAAVERGERCAICCAACRGSTRLAAWLPERLSRPHHAVHRRLLVRPALGEEDLRPHRPSGRPAHPVRHLQSVLSGWPRAVAPGAARGRAEAAGSALRVVRST